MTHREILLRLIVYQQFNYVKHKNVLWLFQKVSVQTDGVFKINIPVGYVELKQIHFSAPVLSGT
jgi:hypothetical protein